MAGRKGSTRRSFTRDFKVAVLARMAETDSVEGLARELRLDRRMLYRWRDRYQAEGSEGLRRAGRPGQSGVAERTQPEVAAARAADPQQRIAELERKIGQQQLDVDFLSAALRHVRERRQPNGAPGEKASTP